MSFPRPTITVTGLAGLRHFGPPPCDRRPAPAIYDSVQLEWDGMGYLARPRDQGVTPHGYRLAAARVAPRFDNAGDIMLWSLDLGAEVSMP